MSTLSRYAIRIVVFVLSLAAHFAHGEDGGGKDVTVALFTTHHATALTLSPAGNGAWTAACATCAKTPLTSTMRLEKPAELFAGGSLRFVDVASGEQRTTTGLWHVRKQHADDAFDVVLTLPSERYVEAVLAAEADAREPEQSLQAMAIVVRTYALNGSHYTTRPGHLPAALCDSTQCQTLRFGSTPARVSNAVFATAGETLWFHQRRAEVFFSQSCGGTTEEGAAVWPALKADPYLGSHADPYCVRKDAAHWHTDISLADLKTIASTEGWRVPANIVAVRVAARSISHRATQVVLVGADGQTNSIAAPSLRLAVGRALGWNKLRSDAYDVSLRDNNLSFDGRGHGHGVGLCQVGAIEMAVEGKSARDILAFYFPGTALRITANDEGWVETKLGALTVRSTHELPAPEPSLMQRTWSDAQQRFGKASSIKPTIVVAPSTEMFRQLAVQPGWALASTRAEQIVMQPDAVFAANKVDRLHMLRHEMLHVLVESEAGERTPLWFREGFVEVLNGEILSTSTAVSPQDIDRSLVLAGSWTQAEQAHQAAALRVHKLIARYGVSAVRGWLASGVPASATF